MKQNILLKFKQEIIKEIKKGYSWQDENAVKCINRVYRRLKKRFNYLSMRWLKFQKDIL